MNTYAATYVAGTEEIITKKLKQFPLEQLKIIYSDDSFIVFRSTLPETKIANLRFFNNIFSVLASNKKTASLDQLLEEALSNVSGTLALYGKNFRLSVMEEGELQPFDPKLRKKLTQAITAQYSMTELSHRPNIELWFILRRSGFGVFGWKLPHIQFKFGSQPAGVLRPELTHILCLVAGLDGNDVVLDPFAGSGAILQEALAGFHAKQAIAVEKDKRLLRGLKKKPKLKVVEGNATNLSFIKSDSIDKVITDPPWGSFTKLSDQELNSLYSGSLKEIARVLKSGGVGVILTSAQKPIEHALSNVNNVKLIKTCRILVSGQKAAIYKLRKN